MYSGKTTIGRKLAECLDTRFVDLDQLFEEHYHTSIPLFFNRYGEDAFRKLEQLMLHSTHTLNHVVISTGGGTPCFFDNMEWINAHGISVYLNGFPTIPKPKSSSPPTIPTSKLWSRISVLWVK